MTMLNDRSARFLMCRPEHFAVSYAINPWMDPKSWARDARRARRGGARVGGAASQIGGARRDGRARPARPGAARSRLHRQCGRRARSPGAAGALPASGAPARGSAFRSGVSVAAGARPGRWREKAARAASCSKAPATAFGTQRRNLFWMGYGPRSDAAAARAVEDTFGQRGDRARTCGPALLPHGHGARSAARRRSHVSAERLHRGRNGRDPRAGRAASSASRSPSRTAAASRPTPSASARL